MPMAHPDNIYPKLEKLGLKEVKIKLAINAFANYKIPIVKDWISLKEKELSMKTTSTQSKKKPNFSAVDVIWKEIEDEFDISKRTFSKKIDFIGDTFKRTIIYRDIAHAYFLAKNGFSKPAVILAGSVIEEMLRLFLKHKKVKPSGNTFDKYIETCKSEGFLKSAIYHLSGSVRHFRNLVHLGKEETKVDSISKPTAKGAVAAIFTIANDF